MNIIEEITKEQKKEIIEGVNVVPESKEKEAAKQKNDDAANDNEKDAKNSYKPGKIPAFKPGDTVKVYYKIQEAGKERIQVYEGVVIALNGKGISRTMTVRRISYDIGVERIFPVHSPKISRIDVVRRGFVRRAKLYYLRDRSGKRAKVKESKRFFSSKDDAQGSPLAASENKSEEKTVVEEQVSSQETVEK